jgi:hypothetical protein
MSNRQCPGLRGFEDLVKMLQLFGCLRLSLPVSAPGAKARSVPDLHCSDHLRLAHEVLRRLDQCVRLGLVQ